MLNKEKQPSLQTLEKLCMGFGITLCQFFADDNGWAELMAEQKAHLAQWDTLSAENKLAAERYIAYLRDAQQK